MTTTKATPEQLAKWRQLADKWERDEALDGREMRELMNAVAPLLDALNRSVTERRQLRP